MRAADVLRLAARNAWRGRMRAVLTALSVAIGVASVMLISSLGDSGCAMVEREIAKLGLSGITIYAARGDVSLAPQDAQTVIQRVPGAEEAQPLILEMGGYRIKNDSGSMLLWGVDAGVERVLSVELLHGRMPSRADVAQKRNVAVVDEELAIAQYRRTNIVGKKIVLTAAEHAETFEIIGVIRSQKDGVNQIVGGILPQFAYVPYSTLGELRGDRTLSQIAVRCAENADTEKVGKQASAALARHNHRPNAYQSENLSGHVARLRGIAGLVALLVSAIAAISLAVAGLGIMNTMLAVTRERRREIGIMMAIGARRRDISRCFVVESAIVAGIGGVLGAALGVLGSYAITSALGMPGIFSPLKFLLVECCAVLCGVAFAWIPARRAARYDPIVMLRD